MSSHNTLLGSGFVPNLVRLAFLIVVLGFFFGPMRGLFGTDYQWLSYLIGGLLISSIISMLFLHWKITTSLFLGFLAANLAGFYIMSTIANTTNAREAYVGVAGGDAAYKALFPEALQAWLTEFQAGSANANSTLNDAAFNGQKRLLSKPSQKTSGTDSSRVFYLQTSDLTMTDETFLEEYRAIAREHGDWLGYMARCVHSGGKRVPLFMPEAHEAIELAEQTGRSVCGSGYADEAFGINIVATREAYLSELGVSRCADSRTCLNVKRDLRAFGDLFFPE